MKLRRIVGCLLLSGIALSISVTDRARAASTPWTVWVDDDDDDGDGQPDRVASELDTSGLDERLRVAGGRLDLGGEGLRLFVGSKLVTSKASLPRSKPALIQARAVGRWSFSVDGESQQVTALRAYRVAAGKWIAPLFASVSRERPGAWGSGQDPEAFAVGVRAPMGALPKQIWLRSYSQTKRELDVRGPLTLRPRPCPSAQAQTECGVSESLRLVATNVDRAHPKAGLALQVELGGHVELGLSEHPSDHSGRQELHLVAPGETGKTPRVGQVRLRVHVLRQGAGGSPAVGGTSEGAERVMRRELRDSAALWSQCGLRFAVEQLKVVEPPPSGLLSIGCEQGAMSAGGVLQLNVADRPLQLSWPAGLDPRQVAVRIRAAIERLGFAVEFSDNGRSGYSDLPTVDLLVRDKQGKLLSLTAVTDGERPRPLSSDAGVSVCLGEVALRDGLDHFDDFNASSGTLEERSLVKALQDGDPASIDLFVVPSFASSGRIGESFIYSAGSSMRNVLIVDRAGIRAGSRSYVLAHELGHVLLDMPGHPDDFGVDDPGRLMDSDASESSVFGPRRLSLEDCRRVWSQSGAAAPLPLIQEVASGLPKQLLVESPSSDD